jgi:hypothetical protein
MAGRHGRAVVLTLCPRPGSCRAARLQAHREPTARIVVDRVAQRREGAYPAGGRVPASSAQSPLSTFPRIAVTGAIFRRSAMTGGRPMSPPWIMWSTPVRRRTASGLNRPCVSEMIPILNAIVDFKELLRMEPDGGTTNIRTLPARTRIDDLVRSIAAWCCARRGTKPGRCSVRYRRGADDRRDRREEPALAA